MTNLDQSTQMPTQETRIDDEMSAEECLEKYPYTVQDGMHDAMKTFLEGVDQ